MERAFYNGKFIDVNKLPREQFQIVYEASLKGLVSCPICGEAMRLYLGFRKKPHFIHPNNQSAARCEEQASAEKAETGTSKLEMKEEYIERNGFKIPKSRTITLEPESTATSWKSVRTAAKIPVFEGKTSSSGTSEVMDISLNSAQFQAVTHSEGPLLILAGAGSGKTRVLTARTAYMISEGKINPKSIMLVTFTAKAAKEMRDRLSSFKGLSKQQFSSVLVGTFHSIFYKIIAHHEPERWQSRNLLKYEWQKEQIIKEIGRGMNLDEKEFPFDMALQQIGFWKNTLVNPESVKPKDEWEERTAYLYKHYEQKKHERHQFDFDDMLLGCYKLLKENSQLLARYQQRFRYFLVDEFQDINKVQYEIIKLLSEGSGNLCVVGDDDQSIYGFRGSDPSFILKFDRDYPNAKVITLSENYRSAHSIVHSANKVITFNKQRKIKKMSAQFDNGMAPFFFFPYDEEEEATMIVTDIKERIEQGAKPSDFVILYRTNSSSRALFERLSQSNLPFIIEQDTESFYQRRMVRSLLAYLRLSLDPNHVQAISDLAAALFLKQSVLNDLKAASILEDCSLVEALATLKNVQPFQSKKLKKMVPLFKQLKRLSPLVAIEMVEKEMGFDDFVKKRGNEGNMMERGSDDIRDLKVVAKKFAAVEDFLEHADHMIAMNKEMKEIGKYYTDAIQLMTIHRSKGLEYKHVYILSAVDGGLPHDYALESYRNGEESALEEERRLMYVAMTRAEDSLAISIPETRRGKKAYPSRFLKSLMQ